MKRRRQQPSLSHGSPLRRWRQILRAAAAVAAVPLASWADADFFAPVGTLGNWGADANWSLGHQPANLDSAIVSSANIGGLTANYDAAATATNLSSLTIDSPSHHPVSLSQALNTLTTAVEYVGSVGTGSLTISGGTHTVNGALTFGNSAGSFGGGSVSGGTLTTQSTYVGNGGSGNFTQSGGSHSITGSASNGLFLGFSTGSTGAYNLSAGALSQTNGAGEFIGYGGAGAFNQSGGANNAANLYLGYLVSGTSVATGTYALSNGASLTTAVNEYVGYSGQGVFNQSGGMHVISGTNVYSNGTPAFFLGFNAGAGGTYTLSGGVFAPNVYEYVGYKGLGVFNQSGGTHQVFALSVGDQVGSSGTFNLSGGSLISTLGSGVGGGVGVFNQSGGSFSTDALFLGTNSFGGSGTYNLSNSASLTITSSFGEIVGQVGPGIFNQTGGTHTISGPLIIAESSQNFSPNCSGTVNISGGVVSAAEVDVGGTTSNPLDIGGFGQLNIAGGSVTAVSVNAFGTSTVTLSGGILNTAALRINPATPLFPGWSQFQFNAGTLNLNGSTSANTGNLTIASNGGSAMLNQSGSNTVVSAGGDLTLGAGSASVAIYNLRDPGKLLVGGNEYIGYAGAGVLNQSSATHSIAGTLYLAFSPGSSGTCNLLSGSLTAGGIVVNAGGRFNLMGASLTTGALTINPNGTFAGFGVLTSTNQSTLPNAGTLMAQSGNLLINYPNLNSSGLLSNGVAANLFINSASITNTGNITVNAQGGVVFAAPLTNGVGQTITLNGGALSAPQITNGGSITGFGQISGDLVNSGISVTFIGPTQIVGNVTNAAGANITVRNSQLLITGQAVNNGTIRAVTGGSVAFDGGLSGNQVLAAGPAAAAAAAPAAAYAGAVTLEPYSSLVAPFLQQDSLTLQGAPGVASSYSLVLLRSRAFGGEDSTLRLLSIQTDGAGNPLGRVDLADTHLTLDAASTPAATVKQYLAGAYTANQDWSGPGGITSALAAANPVKYSVGYAAGDDASAQDAGIPVAPGSVLVRAVLTGDANLDGKVDFFDIAQVLGYRYNGGGNNASYTDGDLNYDGKVDFFDIVTLLSANYNSGETFAPAAAAATITGERVAAPPVPEPASLSLVTLAASALVARPRRLRGTGFSSRRD
jgi:hypothetical protein